MRPLTEGTKRRTGLEKRLAWELERWAQALVLSDPVPTLRKTRLHTCRVSRVVHAWCVMHTASTNCVWCVSSLESKRARFEIALCSRMATTRCRKDGVDEFPRPFLTNTVSQVGAGERPRPSYNKWEPYSQVSAQGAKLANLKSHTNVIGKEKTNGRHGIWSIDYGKSQRALPKFIGHDGSSPAEDCGRMSATRPCRSRSTRSAR